MGMDLMGYVITIANLRRKEATRQKRARSQFLIMECFGDNTFLDLNCLLITNILVKIRSNGPLESSRLFSLILTHFYPNFDYK